LWDIKIDMINHSDIKKKFTKNGFAIIKNLLSTKEIKQFENDFIKVYSRILKKSSIKKIYIKLSVIKKLMVSMNCYTNVTKSFWIHHHLNPQKKIFVIFKKNF
jgi:hypothetical protein